MRRKTQEQKVRYIIEFDSSEMGRYSRFVAIIERDRSTRKKLYLYESDEARVVIGGSDKKALSFSNAYLAVIYLSRNEASRILRPLARIERMRVCRE